MTVVTILGAGGKMGNRITKPLLETKKYQLRFVEKSEVGQARIRESGLEVMDLDEALKGGDFGVIYSQDGATKFSPTFHALSALGAHRAHEITIATSVDNSWVAFENREAKIILVASFRPWSIEITSKVLAGYSSMQSLRSDDSDRASQIMDWWSYAQPTAISAEFPLTLTPFEIALIRG
jgi:hypothetical protein